MRMRIVAAIVAVAAIASACANGPSDSAVRRVEAVGDSAGITVEIVNSSGRDDSDVYVMITAGEEPQEASIEFDKGISIEQLKARSGNDTPTFQLQRAVAGEIWISYDEAVSITPAPPSIELSKVRFQAAELTYGIPNSGANLTAVAYFAIPMDLAGLDARGNVLSSVGFACNTDVIDKELKKAGADFERVEKKTSSGGLARIIAPATNDDGFPSLEDYVKSMAGQTITTNNTFGLPNVPAEPYEYSGTFGPDGTITMTGTIAPGTHGEPLVIEGSSLPEAIYTQNGKYTVGGKPGTVGDNDVYSSIYADIVAGFNYGFWGGRYGDNSNDFKGAAPFAAARSDDLPYYSTYASVLDKYSNAYGAPFSDRFGQPAVFVPLDNAAKLRLEVLPDESPAGCAENPPTTTTTTTIPRTYSATLAPSGIRGVATATAEGLSLSPGNCIQISDAFDGLNPETYNGVWEVGGFADVTNAFSLENPQNPPDGTATGSLKVTSPTPPCKA